MGKAAGVIVHRRGRAPKGWWRISVMDMEILCRRLELTGYGRPPVGVRRFFGWTVRLETRWVSAIRAAIPYSEAQGSLMFPRPDPHIGGVRLKDRMASGTIRLKSDAPGGSGQPSRVWHYRNDRPFFDVARADVIPPISRTSPRWRKILQESCSISPRPLCRRSRCFCSLPR